MPRVTIDELLAQARGQLSRLHPRDAFARLQAGAFLIDVRTADQIARDGQIPGASEISLNVLEWRVDPDCAARLPGGPSLQDEVILLCDGGYCSSLAAARLQLLGFRAATDVIGGFRAWREQDLPVVPPARREDPLGEPA